MVCVNNNRYHRQQPHKTTTRSCRSIRRSCPCPSPRNIDLTCLCQHLSARQSHTEPRTCIDRTACFWACLWFRNKSSWSNRCTSRSSTPCRLDSTTRSNVWALWRRLCEIFAISSAAMSTNVKAPVRLFRLSCRLQTPHLDFVQAFSCDF